MPLLLFTSDLLTNVDTKSPSRARARGPDSISGFVRFSDPSRARGASLEPRALFITTEPALLQRVSDRADRDAWLRQHDGCQVTRARAQSNCAPL